MEVGLGYLGGANIYLFISLSSKVLLTCPHILKALLCIEARSTEMAGSIRGLPVCEEVVDLGLAVVVVEESPIASY